MDLTTIVRLRPPHLPSTSRPHNVQSRVTSGERLWQTTSVLFLKLPSTEMRQHRYAVHFQYSTLLLSSLSYSNRAVGVNYLSKVSAVKDWSGSDL